MVSVSVTTYTFQYIHFIIMTSYHTLIQYSAYKLTECILKIFVPPYSCLTDVSVCGRHHCRGHSHPPHQPPLGGLNVKLLQLKTLSDTYMLSPWFTPHYWSMCNRAGLAKCLCPGIAAEEVDAGGSLAPTLWSRSRDSGQARAHR